MIKTVDPKTITDWQELFEAMQLIEEMCFYLGTNKMTSIAHGSGFHRNMLDVVSLYYAKRS